MNNTITALCIDAVTLLDNVPAITFVLVGKVMSANEPCSIDGV